MLVFVTEILLNGGMDFNEICCVSPGGFENDLDSQFSPLVIHVLVRGSYEN